MSNALTLIMDDINAARDDFMALLCDKSISFEREAGFAIQVLSNSDYALGVATNNRQSVINAVKNIAAIGISLNPAKKQAYLVPRRAAAGMPPAICLDISYMGLLDLAVASGSVMWGVAELVHEKDVYKRNGLGKEPTHEFEPFSKQRGPIIGVYVAVKLHNGDFLTTTMDIDEVFSIRERSEAWKSFVAKKIKSCPWSTDEGEMIKKTVIKRAYKMWPKTERMDTAIHHLNTDGGEGLVDINAKPDNWIDVAPIIAQALQTKTDALALAYWREHGPLLVDQPKDYAKLKDAVKTHRAKMAADNANRTVDMPKAAPVVSDALDGLMADMEAAADCGMDALNEAWGSLSKATQARLQPHRDALDARASGVAA